MLTLTQIKSEFKPNTPIFLSDLENRNIISSDALRKSFSRMAKTGELQRFQKGIYYIPEKTIFGASSLNPADVIRRKYLSDDNNQYGVLTGLALLNKWGLTTQVPNVIEISTNNETNRKRQVKLGGQSVILKRSRTPITNENATLVEFLEALSSIDFNNGEQLNYLCTYLKNQNFSRSLLDQVLISYPKKIYQKLVESGMINDFA
jgi:predicted transcriptional regulator of viral defense system